MPDHFQNQYSSVWSALAARDAQQKLEEKLRRWAKPPSDSEIEKCERAVRMVKQAIAADEVLKSKDIEIFAKGSFANRTNIPSDSDVDVAVVLKELYLNDYPAGKNNSDFGFTPASYTFNDFKKDVARAVSSYFGSIEVSVGNKAILVHSNSARVDADVVPHAVHRRYDLDGSYVEGVALVSSDGRVIRNWPLQDYSNAVSKNDSTARRYKALVRIVKNLRREMIECSIKSAEGAQSYLIACLLWNVPDYVFDDESYARSLENCLNYLVERTSDLQNVSEWGEVNELKYLFRPSQAWKFDEVHAFLFDARNFLRAQK